MMSPTHLSTLTTLKVGGPVARVYECGSLAALEEALTETRREGLPWFPLGGGSNVLAPDEGFDGSILLMRMPSLHFSEGVGDTVMCVAEAGVDWNELVDEAAERGLWGIENLAGIPGRAGAAPIQNIGAYGTELSDTLEFVDVYETDSKKTYRLSAFDCGLAYRDSRFKREPNLLVLAVGLTLRKDSIAKTHYKDITLRVEDGADVSTPAQVAALVREIRSRKFPDLNEYGTAGSFFKNPVISKEHYAELKSVHADLPGYPADDKIKVPLAWILDNMLMLRGHTLGKASLFLRQPLVLVTDEGASARDVEALACDVAERVYNATGITIEREVRTLEPHA